MDALGCHFYRPISIAACRARVACADSVVSRCRRLSGRFRDRYDGERLHFCPSWTVALMTDDSDDFRRLMDAVLAGDGDALASLFSMYRDRLRRMVELRMDARLRGRVSASDILQEAYIGALQRLPHYQASAECRIFVWLRAVTMQRLIDVHRRHVGGQVRDAGREVRLGEVEAIEAGSGQIAELFANTTSPSLAARRGEIMALVREALEQLDPIDREVLVLRHFEQMSNHEAAAVACDPAGGCEQAVCPRGRASEERSGADSGFRGGLRHERREIARPGANETVDVAFDGDREPFERVAEEFVERCRRGESPSVAEYLERYPEHAETIRKLLPAVAMIERLGQGAAQPSAEQQPPRPTPVAAWRFPDHSRARPGGMGVVYEAVQESLGRKRRAQGHPPGATRCSGGSSVFSAKRRRSPGCTTRTSCRSSRSVSTTALPYYAMQYIRGRGLDALIETGGVTKRQPTASAGGSWRGSASRRRRRFSMPTSKGSYTATSSRRTCWSMSISRCGSRTSAWRSSPGKTT